MSTILYVFTDSARTKWHQVIAYALLGVILPAANAMGQVRSAVSAGLRTTYVEDFTNGPGGWYRDRYFALPVWDGVAYSYSPWWLDANHAPPGAGYLHMVMWLFTEKSLYAGDDEYMRKLPYRGSPFAERGYSRDLRNAKFSVRLRGDVDLKGAQLVLHVQAKTRKTTANAILTGQPFRLTREWSEQTVKLVPDEGQWTCLGSRHDMTDEYGCDDIGAVLSDVNLDIMLMLFPVRMEPACGPLAEPHRARAVKDYPVNQDVLPKGVIMVDWIRIDYPR